MNCKLKYKIGITDKVREIVVNKAQNYTVEGNTVVIPLLPNSSKLNTEERQEYAAISAIARVNKTFKPEKYGEQASYKVLGNKDIVVTIHPTERLISAYEVKNNQKELEDFIEEEKLRGGYTEEDKGEFFQSSSESKEQANQKINTKLKNFLLKQGISLEYLDKITDEFGGNITAVFNSIKKTIKVAKGEEKLDTLPEEVGHAITRGLGKDHPLVKKLFNLIKRTDYKSKLDPRYVELYKGNEDALIEELAGKYIAQAIINEYKEDSNILDTIKKLIKKFLELFKTSNLSDLQQIEKDIQSVSNELAKTVESKELLKFNTREQPSNPELFQISEEDKSKKYLINKVFPMLDKNLEKIGVEKRFSVRPKYHPSGYYKLGNNYYQITNVYDRKANISEIKNPDFIKNKSIGNEEIEFQHIKDFYEGKSNMYVYQIQKLDGDIVNQLKESEKEQKKGYTGQKYEAELVALSRLLSTLKKRVKRLKEEGDEERANITDAKLVVLQVKFDRYKKDKDIEILEDLANEAVNRAEQFINAAKSGKFDNKITDLDFAFSRELLETFSSRTSIGDLNRASRLWQELLVLQENHILEYINKNDRSGKLTDIKSLETEEQKQDIGGYKRWIGKLSSVTNKLGATIGSMINAAHDRVTKKNKETKTLIQEHIDRLTKYQNSKGLQGKDIFNIFIQEAGGTTVLTRPYTTEFYNLLDSKDSFEDKLTIATWDRENKVFIPHNLAKYSNEDYRTIQKEKPLRDFYNFHKELTSKLKDELPTRLKDDFIANLRVDLYDQVKRGDKTVLEGLGDTFKNLINVREVKLDDFKTNEELKADVLDSRKYQSKLAPEEKSRDLGQNLLAFAQFVNSYTELSDTLPKVRLLQSHLNESTNFIKANNPSTRIEGKDTNLAKLVEDTIQMQLLGNKKKEEGKKELEGGVDENGNPTKRYFLWSDIGDMMLKYNSLLRIGLNPMNAFSNVTFGEVTNFIEASGGRFFSIKNMNDATKMFISQNEDKKSLVNTLLEKINPLQEIEDYENIENIKTKGSLSGDRFQNIMYSPQKVGEKFIQSRTMIAMMIKQELVTPQGELTAKGEELLKDEEAIQRFSIKIKGLNEKLHGRYSQRSAAAAQQFILFRIASQFRKWIPAAIEARFESKYTDNDIGEDFEGRYNTFGRVVIKEALKGNFSSAFSNFILPLINQKKALDSGKLSEMEIYNMRKNLTEATILLSIVLLTALAKGGQDDKEWRKKAGTKFLLEQLNRLAGDIDLFYSPKSLNRTLLGSTAPLSKTIDDLITIGINTQYIFSTDDKKAYYQRGSKKREHKFWGNIPDAIPGAKPVVASIRLFKKDVEYLDPTK